jgi:hypothetical protein
MMRQMILCDHCGCRITAHWEVFAHATCRSAQELIDATAKVRHETWLLRKQQKRLEKLLAQSRRMGVLSRAKLAQRVNTRLGGPVIRHEISIDIHEA